VLKENPLSKKTCEHKLNDRFSCHLCALEQMRREHRKYNALMFSLLLILFAAIVYILLLIHAIKA